MTLGVGVGEDNKNGIICDVTLFPEVYIAGVVSFIPGSVLGFPFSFLAHPYVIQILSHSVSSVTKLFSLMFTQNSICIQRGNFSLPISRNKNHPMAP